MHDDPQVPVPPPDDGPDDDIASRRAPLARRYPLWTRLQIPPEKQSVRLSELPLSVRCLDALWGNDLLSLGDLDGHALIDILRQTDCGLACLRELCVAFVDMEVLQENHPDPIRAAIHVPAFAAGYRVDELPLRPLARGGLLYAGFVLLGDLEAASPNRLTRAGRIAIRGVTALLKTLEAAGPPEPQGLLDALDLGLDRLREVRRQIVLHRFGAGGDPPMTFVEIGIRIAKSGARVGMILQDALRELPVLAWPQFGPAFRELVSAVTHGQELAAELSRVGRNPTLKSERRPWDSPLFYEALITALAPSLAPTGRPARLPSTVSEDDVQRPIRQPTSRTSKARPNLKDTIDALTESLVDSVITAIRSAPLEEVLGDDVLGRTVTKSVREPERPPRRRRTRASSDAGNQRRSVADAIPTAAKSVARAEQPIPPDAAADITDPQLLLSLDVPPENAEEGSQHPRESTAPSIPLATEDRTVHVKLRDNETAVRLAKGGIVIRRGRVPAPAPGGVGSS
jgi:hypothetical protein